MEHAAAGGPGCTTCADSAELAQTAFDVAAAAAVEIVGHVADEGGKPLRLPTPPRYTLNELMKLKVTCREGLERAAASGEIYTWMDWIMQCESSEDLERLLEEGGRPPQSQATALLVDGGQPAPRSLTLAQLRPELKALFERLQKVQRQNAHTQYKVQKVSECLRTARAT
eukprot:TRINITY_DN37794_c0_g1_i1.p1 TRINITY_DN37794_c0_g1~~TRINITY_DN37794_c0_g1_i1.p1  ORF type:complete len:190 (-),score=28.41 TRINITY_DN37794_c0_g1_i1:398-907(-)